MLPLLAQANEQQGQQKNRGVLEEITVTAQKRSESLQSVPITITALTSDRLAQANISRTDNLSFITPSLNFTRTANYASIYMRGIGTDTFSPGSEPSVALYVDGVYIADNSTSVLAFNNIERIEVLKGPQGTLYGRNAAGGLISIITRTPTQDLQADASVGYGNFNATEAKAYVGGGIAHNLAADIAVSWRHQGRGYARNIAQIPTQAGSRVGIEDYINARTKWVADFAENVKFTFSANYSSGDNTTFSPRQPGPNQASAPVVPPGGVISSVPNDYSVNWERAHLQSYGASGKLEIQTDAVNIVSITAWRKANGDNYGDLDDTDVDTGHFDTFTKYKQFTHEVQFLSPEGSKIDWIVGAFYMNADQGYDPIKVYGPYPILYLTTSYKSRIESVAGYAQSTVHVFENGRFTAGFRYTYDRKNFRGTSLPGVDVTTWKKPTWRLAYDHTVGENTMLFASYNRGFKSGAYNTAFGTPPAIDPVTVDAFEVGIKTDLLDNRLRVNASAFYNTIRGIEARVVLPGNLGIVLQNAAKGRSQGIDGDITAIVTDDLRMNVGFSWVDNKYISFPGAAIYVPNPNGPGFLNSTMDASGNHLPRTPTLSGSIGFNYNHTLGDESKIYANALLFLSSKTYWDPSDRIVSSGYHVLNGTIGYTLPGGQWSAEIWGQNITNEKYAAFVSGGNNSDRWAYGIPRTFGIRINFKY